MIIINKIKAGFKLALICIEGIHYEKKIVVNYICGGINS